MRVLASVTPTSEQLPIIGDYRDGFVLIRGAAGSGKTTTAVLRLRQVIGVWLRQRAREESAEPVRVLVLTFNRSLKGYVERLVEEQIDSDLAELTLSTFGHWAWETLGRPDVLKPSQVSNKLWSLGSGAGYSEDFLADEVDYVLGRYMPGQVSEYTDPQSPNYERRGRGLAPRVERQQRERLVGEVIEPYRRWKRRNKVVAWSDVDIQMASRSPSDDERWDVVVVDEAQDFSANQIRAIKQHLSPTHSTTFVLDAMQRIYPRGLAWSEVDIEFTHRYHLQTNHRNTKQIAAFAQPLVAGLPREDDGTLPDFESCVEEGALPLVVRGRFARQMSWVTDRIRSLPEGESIALLHAKGGNWFRYVRARLDAAKIPYVDLQRRQEWPRGEEEVGLSTLHSAKGLEFDHVMILGLAAEQMPHGPEEDDAQLDNHRRLVAMAVGRARKTVALTYKPGEESRVVDLLNSATCEVVEV
jgi:superfamily I DNA/RNA helicase